MRKLLTLCVMSGALSALGMAATTTWSGTLVNLDCFTRGGSVKACPARTSTERFMIVDKNGKQVRFDGATNDRTRAAMQARASKSSRFGTKRTPVFATATGESRQDGTRFRADTVRLR